MLQAIDQAMERMGSLNYTLARVMQVVNDISSSALDLVRVIEMDPVLTARVLRVSNSSFFGFNEPVTSLRRATIMMGMNTVRNLALAVAIRNAFQIQDDACQVSSEDFWRYAVGTAVLSDLLAHKAEVSRSIMEESFVVALLHPIGRALFIQHFPAEYREVIAVSMKRGVATEKFETRKFSIDHTEVGVRMAERWGLPAEVSDGIACYRKPEKSSRESTWILSIASNHIKEARVGFCGDYVPHPVPDEFYERLGLTPADVETILAESFREELAKANDFIKGH